MAVQVDFIDGHAKVEEEGALVMYATIHEHGLQLHLPEAARSVLKLLFSQRNLNFKAYVRLSHRCGRRIVDFGQIQPVLRSKVRWMLDVGVAHEIC